MSQLKQVIHDAKTNSVEATWVERTVAPDTVVPEELLPDTIDEDGNVILGKVIPAHIVPGAVTEVQTRCHSYSDRQMAMLRSDLGADATEYEALMVQVESNQIPYPEPTPEQVQAAQNQASLSYLASTDWMVTRFADTGVAIPDDVKMKRQAARDGIVR